MTGYITENILPIKKDFIITKPAATSRHTNDSSEMSSKLPHKYSCFLCFNLLLVKDIEIQPLSCWICTYFVPLYANIGTCKKQETPAALSVCISTSENTISSSSSKKLAEKNVNFGFPAKKL